MYTASDEEGMATTNQLSPPECQTPERPWEQLGRSSHYCASLTPASDHLRRGCAQILLERFPRFYFLRRANARACVHARGENDLVASLVATSRTRLTYRVTVSRRIRWDSSRGTRKMWRDRLAFGGSFGECDTFCDAVSTPGRGSSYENDHHDEEVLVDGDGVLLAPAGARY